MFFTIKSSMHPSLQNSFSVKKPRILSNLMQQNQRNDFEELTYVTFGFDWHNACLNVMFLRQRF